MAAENLVAVGSTPADSRVGHGLGGNVKGWSRTIEITAAAEVNSTYVMGYIPANARILGQSEIAWDDVASSGAPTLDIGLAAVDGNITSDPDALNDGLDCAGGAGSARVVKNIANYGKKAWQYVNGQTTEPKGDLAVYVTLADAAANTGGTVTVELLFLVP